MKKGSLICCLVLPLILFCVTGCTADNPADKNRDTIFTSQKALDFTEEITIEKEMLDSSVIFDRDSETKTDAGNFAFQSISPGFCAASDVAYRIDAKTGKFSFVITWTDSGNPLYVGLLNEENKAYVILLEGGTATYSIDISNLSDGKYNVVVVHQGKYAPTITGAISYRFLKD